ncbi:GGDEF domain-containing protein [Vibrio sp. SCSIO 43136]|uniref:GGDEF domain-containing protein n=1 Tax=Vibrio sp. SCSIO 43136 TaxID=2819101 RepID=UPI0020765B68|nr:GGDEF domain-containing protein [Vibrio sp. SCSIO 43136]USD67747.1 GGDEF domain-containing protein [Vibrio sp. SCSIO 43136]
MKKYAWARIIIMTLAAIVIIVCSSISIDLIKRSSKLVEENGFFSGRGAVQLLLMHQLFSFTATRYLEGKVSYDELVQAYDLSWSAFDILLDGAGYEELLENKKNELALRQVFANFESIDPTLGRFNAENYAQYVANKPNANEVLNVIYNDEFQRIANYNYQRDEQLSHSIELMSYALATALCISLLLLISGIRNQTKLHRFSLIDSQTKLANRNSIRSYLDKKIEMGEPFALIYLELDGFDALRLKHGHPLFIKELNKAIMQTEQATPRANVKMFAHIEANQIAMVTQNTPDNTELANELIELMSVRVVVRGHRYPIRAFCGIVMGAENARSSDKILDAGYQALQQTKQGGHKPYTVIRLERMV